MRAIFDALAGVARTKGIWGCFVLELHVESERAPIADIVGALARQRLAAHPERPLEYPWGKAAFRELPRRFRIPRTRLYAPRMLERAFGWNSDLPEADGLICHVATREWWTEEALEPIGLVWSNKSDAAVAKRAWGPLDVFGEATNQITPGEFGIIYVAYQEGTREEIADQRTEHLLERLKEWTHPGSIRLPISFFVRLFPRVLEHGAADLIESTVQVISGVYGTPELFEDFPSAIFSPGGGIT